jgi:hypothetical protein
MIDRYTQAVLSVIAVALVALVWQQVTSGREQQRQQKDIATAIYSVRGVLNRYVELSEAEKEKQTHSQCGTSDNPCYIATPSRYPLDVSVFGVPIVDVWIKGR